LVIGLLIVIDYWLLGYWVIGLLIVIKILVNGSEKLGNLEVYKKVVELSIIEWEAF